MDITKLQVSQHIKDDRLDRYVEIQMNTGIANLWQNSDMRINGKLLQIPV